MAADPETRTIPSGQNVCTLRIATNRTWTGQDGQKQEQTEFHSVVAWSRLADIASRYLRKGGLVMIEGRLQTRSWDGQDGVKRYRTEIVAESLQLGPRSANTASGGNWSPSPSQASQNRPVPVKRNDSEDIKDEDIPVINQDEPFESVRQNTSAMSSVPNGSPQAASGEPSSAVQQSEPVDEVEEKEIDLKDIPF